MVLAKAKLILACDSLAKTRQFSKIDVIYYTLPASIASSFSWRN